MPVPGELTLVAPRRAKPPRHLADLAPGDRRAAVEELGHKGFRAAQLSTHYFGHHSDDPATWTDIPVRARDALATALFPRLLNPVRDIECDAGTTRKTLWRLFDGALVESVLMRYPDRVTVCVSSQAGCGMNCPFCATGQAGLTRNMSTAEIVDQVVAAARTLERGEVAGGPGRVSNVVFMGMGEPLANYDRVWAAVERLHADVGLSARHLTISTIGIVPGIRRLAAAPLPVNLAVSLHAADDALRDALVPINRRYPLAELLEACRAWVDAKGRRLSFEWALISGVNDRPADAARLAELARQVRAHVNLIPLNPTPGFLTQGTPAAGVRAFADLLTSLGVNATVRRNRGTDIDAACGQLAAQAARRRDGPD